MKYTIRFEPRAHKEFLALHKSLRERITPRIDALADNPRPASTRALTGNLKGLRKLRVGDYRVSYRVDDEAQVVTIIEVGHRRDIYRRMARRR